MKASCTLSISETTEIKTHAQDLLQIFYFIEKVCKAYFLNGIVKS